MASRRRKTLVVCRRCHEAIHAGRPLPQRVSAYITGKRCDAKVSRTVWREADGKGLYPEYLAGGPPYLVPSWYLVNPSNWRPDERGRLCAQQQRRCDCPHGRQKRTSAIGTGGNEPS